MTPAQERYGNLMAKIRLAQKEAKEKVLAEAGENEKSLKDMKSLAVQDFGDAEICETDTWIIQKTFQTQSGITWRPLSPNMPPYKPDLVFTLKEKE